ncbi:hypothetical protein MLIT_30450 [Mycolicibacterium litorale]|uniref:Uncharacterized protein n=1 Tax=Mycolicibacterium litorale TaxID=758802 RepID=A0AAD1IN08_9MYCO|nr:hypothetical protein BCL50_1600 [Mycolicibacterium litorale]BBY17453.1 hypothetical protein MLIT_30450 [Mycolicibacterium litorale]
MTAPHTNERAYLRASSQVKTQNCAVPPGSPPVGTAQGLWWVAHHPQALAALRSVAATSSAPSRTALPKPNRISFSAAAA